MGNMPWLFYVVILLIPNIAVLCKQILILCPLSVRSHKHLFDPLVSELSSRGHDITVVSAWKPLQVKTRVREVVVLPGFEYFPNVSILQLRKDGLVNPVPLDSNYLIQSCHHLYHNPEFLQLLHWNFSLILVDSWLVNCLFGFIAKLNAPFMYLSPAPSKTVLREFPTVPPGLFPEPDVTRRAQEHKLFEGIYRAYLGKDSPPITDFQQRVSFMFMNAHFGLNPKIDDFSNVLDVGGFHCRPALPLAQDLEDFVSSNPHGFIFVSFGSVLKTNDIALPTREIFINVFGKLKQNVLWKSDDLEEKLPGNVRVVKWLPQQDVLGHPNIKAFVTHGGLLSTQEAIYHGVPMVGIPVCSDQDFNVRKLVSEKVAVGLEILNVTESALEAALHLIMTDNRYLHRLQVTSNAFQKSARPVLNEMLRHVEEIAALRKPFN